MAQLEEEVDWSKSQKRIILFSLLYGPMDWIVEGAILALTQTVLKQKIQMECVVGWMWDIIDNLPRPGW